VRRGVEAKFDFSLYLAKLIDRSIERSAAKLAALSAREVVRDTNLNSPLEGASDATFAAGAFATRNCYEGTFLRSLIILTTLQAPARFWPRAQSFRIFEIVCESHQTTTTRQAAQRCRIGHSYLLSAGASFRCQWNADIDSSCPLTKASHTLNVFIGRWHASPG
jgi:hypothetical protein